MPKEIKEKIIEILNKIEITIDVKGDKQKAIFWIDDKIITPKKLADKILELIAQEKQKWVEEKLKGIDMRFKDLAPYCWTRNWQEFIKEIKDYLNL